MPQDKLPVPKFAAKIKAKYPQYKDIDDTVLVQKILAKYPEYNDQVDMTGVVKKKGGTGLSMVRGKVVPNGGQVGSSKAPSSGLVPTGTETQADIDRQKKFAEMEGVEYDPNDPLKSYVRANENKFAKQRQKPVTESTSSKVVKLAESIQNKEAVKEKAQIESFRFNNVEEAKEFAYKRLDKSKLVPKSSKVDLTQAEGIKNYTDESILNAAGDNITVNKAVSQYLRNKNVKENLQSSANFSEAAIKTALTKNDDRAAQISKLLASGREIPSTMRGDIILEYLNDPDVLEEVSSNSELLSQYRKEIYDFPKSNPETAIKIMAQMVSKKREEKGYNNGLLNAPSKSTTDEIIDELVQEGQLPVQYKYLYERPGVGMAVNSSLKTPGFIEGTLQSANEAVEGIGSTLKGLADMAIYNVGGNIAEETGLRNLYSTEEQQAKNDFYKSTEGLYNGLDREYSEVAFKPNGILHEFTTAGGLVTGQVLPMIAGGSVLKSANLVNTAEGSNMIMAGMQSFGRNKERAAVELPNASAEKQLAYATLNTGIEIALSNVFNDVEYARKLMKGVSPEVKSVITRFTNKEITESVAKQSINDIFLKVAEKGVQVAKGMVGVAEKEAREESLTEILQIANNQVFGGQDVDAYDIAKKSFDVWRTTFLGSLPLGVGGGIIEVSKNPTMQKLVYGMATNPEKYAKIIQENSQLDEKYGADLDQKMSNLEYIAKVKQDLDAMEGMNQVDKEKFLITSLNQKIVADQAAQITEPTLRKEPEKAIQKLEAEKEQILSNPTPLTKEQEAIKVAVDNGTLQGMNQMMAVEAIKDPEVAKSYLQMVADQAKNEVATVEGAETQSKANIDFGEDLVKIATEMFPKREPRAEDISQPIELDPTLPEGYELPGQTKVEAGSVGVGGDENAWGSDKGLTENFYTTDVDGYAIKKPITNPSSVTIDGVDFHIAKVDGDWKVIEKKSGLEISTGKISNTKNAAIEDATIRLAQNGGAKNLPTLIDRAIQGFKDRNTKAVEQSLKETPTETEVVGVEGENPALKDVEATAKALEGVDLPSKFVAQDKGGILNRENYYRLAQEKFQESEGLTTEEIFDKNKQKEEFKTQKGRDSFQKKFEQFAENPINKKQIISEAYHKAKADGSNPELVKAVEELLGAKESQATPLQSEAESKAITEQIETFGVGKEQVKPVQTLIEKTFEGLRKAGLTTAKTVSDWVGIGKGQEKPYSLKINGKETQVKNVQPEVVNGFYSPLEKVIAETKFDKLPAKQWVEKFAKGEEAKWTGLTDWLNQQQGSVSKADIQQYLKDNRIQVVEVVKTQKDYRDDWDKENDNPKDLTKFSQYQLEGEKENYKEVLVTLPNKIKSVPFWKLAEGESRNSNGDLIAVKINGEWIDKDEAKIKYGVDYDTINNEPEYKFKSNHFDEPNILVHLRMNTRTDVDGNKVLFLEEVQSDWGQKGKREGFSDNFTADNIKIIGTPSETDPFDFEIAGVKDRGKLREGETIKEWKERTAKDYRKHNIGVPNAPFVSDTNSWTKLALKTALKEAVKQGADKIAWTTGEQQNERYDLSKQVDDIYLSDWSDRWEEGNKWRKVRDVEITVKGGDVEKLIIDEKGQIIGGEYDNKNLSDVIGKDITEKILNEKEGTNLQGEGLKVGGKGMKGFYGSPTEGSLGIVGNVAKSLFKQEPKPIELQTTSTGISTQDKVLRYRDWVWKNKNEDFSYNDAQKDIQNNSKLYQEYQKNIPTQHSIDITPELRKQAEEGQPLFKKAQAQYRIESGKNIIEAIKNFDGSQEATVALTHEIMHPTVVSIIDGAKEGNEVGARHTKTIIDEYNKANPKNKITEEQLIADNDAFKNGNTTKQYRAVQEFIAEAWERYHLEGGKGFSAEFQKVLQQITEAFKAVYSSLTGKELTPELRKMFDEILGKEFTGQVENFEAALNERTDKKRDKALKNFGDKEADARGLIEDYDTNIEKLKAQGIEPTGTKAEVLADMLSGKYDEQLEAGSVGVGGDAIKQFSVTQKGNSINGDYSVFAKITTKDYWGETELGIDGRKKWEELENELTEKFGYNPLEGYSLHDVITNNGKAIVFDKEGKPVAAITIISDPYEKTPFTWLPYSQLKDTYGDYIIGDIVFSFSKNGGRYAIKELISVANDNNVKVIIRATEIENPNTGEIITPKHKLVAIYESMGFKKVAKEFGEDVFIYEPKKQVEQSLKEQPQAPPQKSDIDAQKEAIETEKQQAITEATKPVVEEDSSKYIGITHAQTNEIANELGFSEYEAKPETVAEWDAKADQMIKDGYDIDKLLKSMDNGKMPDKIEQRIIAKYVATLKAKIEATQSDEDIKEMKRVVDISNVIGGREVGKSLAARKGLYPVDDSLAGYFMREMEEVGVDTLTDEQKAKITKEYNEIKVAQDAYLKKIEELQEENARLKAKEVISGEVKKRSGRKTNADFASERKAIVDDIREKLRKARGEINATPIPYAKELFAIAPDVAKLVKSLVEQGVVKLEDVVSNIHEILSPDIPGITQKDIQDVIAGEYNKAKLTKNELSAKVRDLKDEAILLNKLDALLKGEEPTTEKAKIERNQRIKELRDQIKDVKNFEKEVSNAQKSTLELLAKNNKDIENKLSKEEKIDDAELEKEKKRQQKEYDNEIKKLEKEFEKEKKAEERNKIKAEIKKQKELERELSFKTPEEKALDKQKASIQAQIKKVEEQLKTGDFTPNKPPPIKLDAEGKELKKKLINLKQQRETRILKAQYDKRNKFQKGTDKVLEVFNIPRSVMASTDFSAPLNQAIVATTAYPKIAKAAAAQMFKSAFSQQEFDNWFYDLKDDPRYDLMKELKLGIADPHSPFLTAKEEAFMSGYAERIPIAGGFIKGSERAYVQYLNKMRVDLFNRFIDRFEEQGKSYDKYKKLYQATAKYVNNITGRGDLGGLEQYAPIFNTLLFSPRLMAARVNMLNPYYFGRLPKELKIAYLKDMGTMLSLGSIILGTMALYGATQDDEDKNKIRVETDPRSSDFAKIRQGETRWNVWGGFQPYVRLMGQVTTGERKSSNTGSIQELDGEGAFGTTRFDVMGSFLRGKLSPVPAMLIDFTSGRTATGEKVTLKDEALSHLIPLSIQGTVEAWKQYGPKALLNVGLPSIFGVGTQTYEQKKKEVKSKVEYKGREIPLTKEQKDFFQEKYNEKEEKYVKKVKSLQEYKDLGDDGDAKLALEQQAKRKAMKDSENEMVKKYRSELQSQEGKYLDDNQKDKLKKKVDKALN